MEIAQPPPPTPPSRIQARVVGGRRWLATTGVAILLALGFAFGFLGLNPGTPPLLDASRRPLAPPTSLLHSYSSALPYSASVVWCVVIALAPWLRSPSALFSQARRSPAIRPSSWR